MVAIAAVHPAAAADPAGAENGARSAKTDHLSVKARAAAYRRDLEALAAQSAQSRERQRTLKNEIERLASDEVNVQAALVRTGDQIRSLNRKIDEGVRRLQDLVDTEDDLKAALAAQRSDLAGILATLQRIGRHPPPALVARPSDALGSIRSAILLGAVMPEVRLRTERLQGDLTALATLKKEIRRERAGLEDDARRFAEEDARLELLLAEKAKRRSQSEIALALERKRAEAIAGKAESLNDLIAELDADVATRRKTGDQLASAGGRSEAPGDDRPPAGILRSVPFAKAMGLLKYPADGVPVRTFGEEDSLGDAAQGLSLRVAAEGRVYAPVDARVSYAGPFRSYGQILILDPGAGYHIVLSGMERIDVARDQTVLAGEPIGRMGATRYASAGTIDIQSSEPVLYIEFRRDGRAIDPSPWWATPGIEKVGG